MKKKLFGVSILTLTCLYGLLAAIIILICYLCAGDALLGIGLSLIILVLQFLISPWITDLSMKWLYKVEWNATLPDYLVQFIEDECNKHGIKSPRIGLIHDGGPNAFTYGRTKRDARIVLTDGILNLLEPDEVKAVVGHEIGHIAHMDMLFMTAAQAIPLIFYAIYEMTINKEDKNSSKDNDYSAIAGLIAYVLYILSEYIVLWLSRQREYYADQFSVEETKNPNALASALVKIGFGLSVSSGKVSKGNALGIFDAKTSKSLVVSCNGKEGDKEAIQNAMKWEMWNPWAKWFQLNSTHPLISKRLLAISQMSSSYGQEPYITFDLKQPESYVDDFFIEVVINFLPVLFLIASIVVFVCTQSLSISGICLLLTFISLYIRFMRRYPSKEYRNTSVSELLGEVKVSEVSAIPCTLEGTIIGKGDPGCIFSEDYIFQDQTGIVFLDYNQPLSLQNKIFALFHSQENIGANVVVKGWYRRSPVPYVEIASYTVNEKTKTLMSYTLKKCLLWLGIICSIAVSFIGLL